MTDISNDASLVSLEGEKSVWELTIRPPVADDIGTTGLHPISAILTVTLAANAVAEGNAETTHEIRVSREFPDADAEVPTLLFNVAGSSGIAVSPTRILIKVSASLYFYTYAGTEQTAERINIGGGEGIEYFNDTLLIHNTFLPYYSRYDLNSETSIETYSFPFASRGNPPVHTRLGILTAGSPFRVLPYGKTAESDVEELNTIDTGTFQPGSSSVAHQHNLLFFLGDSLRAGFFILAEITDDAEIVSHGQMNIRQGSTSLNNIRDIAIYRDTLYILEDTTPDSVYTLDIP